MVLHLGFSLAVQVNSVKTDSAAWPAKLGEVNFGLCFAPETSIR